MSHFPDVETIAYEGPASRNPLAFHHYNPDEMVMGKRMEDHLRFAVAYWHSFAWEGNDPFGGQTFIRPWHPQDDMGRAKLKADVAFEMFDLLGAPFFCWHDADIRPEQGNYADNLRTLEEITDYIGEKMQGSDTGLLWGTANMFSHRRWMSGASTNPDPDVFAFSAATVKGCLDATHKLGGRNYVLWGGREGYETLLNTDLGQELDHMGRFLSMVVDYKHKIGFKGQILIEPKPQEPTKHQYDYDVATVYGFLKDFGLEKEVKVNIEQGPAILAGGPDWLRRIVGNRYLRSTVSVVQHPAVAVLLFVGLFYFWLIPPVHFRAMLDPVLYQVMNWSMVVDGILFWTLVVDPRPTGVARVSYGVRAALAIGVLKGAVATHSGMATFAEAGVSEG